ncbi:N-terminal glutamine amidase-domain-containing protein [Dipodascopsis uninucleata]
MSFCLELSVEGDGGDIYLPYTQFYCEENVYKAIEILSSESNKLAPSRYYVVFISSPANAVPLWCQKVSKQSDGFVLWDYHVIILRSTIETRGANSSVEDNLYVLDFDTIMTANGLESDMVQGRRDLVGNFVKFSLYCSKTLRPSLRLEAPYQRVFRVFTASQYFNWFASDRSHMLLSNNGMEISETQNQVAIHKASSISYIKPPPSWPPIQGPQARQHGITMNLMDYFNMTKDVSYSRLLSQEDFLTGAFFGI